MSADDQTSEPLGVRLRRRRMDAVDLVFGEADQKPVLVMAGVCAVVWLVALIWLSGFPTPWSGERGAVVIPAGAETEGGLAAGAGDSVFQWAGFLRSDAEAPEGLPPFTAATGQARSWLDDHVCGPFSDAQSTLVSRAAVAYRITESNRLCGGLDRVMAQARLAPTLGAGLGAVTAGAILILLAAALGAGLYAFSRVRDAYRRLYVSHHRPDPEGR